MQIFDAIIITSSFIFDIVFLGGVTGEEGEKAAAVLVVLLLWRITRVVDGKVPLFSLVNNTTLVGDHQSDILVTFFFANQKYRHLLLLCVFD